MFLSSLSFSDRLLAKLSVFIYLKDCKVAGQICSGQYVLFFIWMIKYTLSPNTTALSLQTFIQSCQVQLQSVF